MVWGSVGLVLMFILWGNSHGEGEWKPVFAILGAGVLGSLWFLSFRIRIDASTLEYSAPFRRTKRICFRDVVRAKVETGQIRFSDAFRPKIRLAITTDSGNGQQTHYLSILNFRGADVAQLLKLLKQHGGPE